MSKAKKHKPQNDGVVQIGIRLKGQNLESFTFDANILHDPLRKPNTDYHVRVDRKSRCVLSEEAIVMMLRIRLNLIDRDREEQPPPFCQAVLSTVYTIRGFENLKQTQAGVIVPRDFAEFLYSTSLSTSRGVVGGLLSHCGAVLPPFPIINTADAYPKDKNVLIPYRNEDVENPDGIQASH